MPRRRITEVQMIRTKIVCTIGPASASVEVLRRLINAGADVFRLNFSHGTHDDHLAAIRTIRELARELGRPFGILGDLSGPKIRIGHVINGEVTIEADKIITFTPDPADGADGRFNITYSALHQVASPGEMILLDDGRFQLVVDSIRSRDVHCRVINGGVLKSRKGVNLPDTKLPIPALTEKDRADLAFALENGVDMIALSFVRSPEDMTLARDAMRAHGRVVPLLAKIEKKEAVERLDEILHLADGAMVARGDLGIEIPMEEVPAIQKRIIHLCNVLAKPVITATQMLESMITNPRPTRAEVADIYNAILDGTDAVMLSAESAAGQYPVEAVEVMNRVAYEAERMMPSNKDLEFVLGSGEAPTVTQAICNSAVRIAEQLALDLIIVPTQTGYSAYNLSRFRPAIPIFACAVDEAAVNAMCLAWGVIPRMMPQLRDDEVAASETDALMNAVIRTAKHAGIARPGQRAVVIGGVPIGKARHTNYLHVIEIK